MGIKEIYQAFDKIGCLSFTTVDEQNQPVSRIAHLRGYDENGIYFMTMYTKDFYKHLKANGNISLCGLCADTRVVHDENGAPTFDGGYAIRMTGKACEVGMDEIKSKQNPIFDFCIADQIKYPAMVVFCITSGWGDVFDYDFEKITRENKLEREYFSFGTATVKYKGLSIDKEVCISCGLCKKKCSFLAIEEKEGLYSINQNRCDECGDCYISCPVKAIHYRGEYKAIIKRI
ncbi:MAG: 4Fe-4S binding protein [Bacillota bacterium]